MIDLHCDTLMKLMLNDTELHRNEHHVDVEKLMKNQSTAQFFAAFVELTGKEDPLQTAMVMIDIFYRELEKNRDRLAFAGNHDDYLANMAEGKISAFLTIEEGGVIQGRLENLRNLYRLGVRLMTLTWNYPNEIGFPNSQYVHRDRGLTDFGIETVREMNRLGMLIDVSHLSDAGFYDVIRHSRSPIVASHSNARLVKEHTRNLDDNMLKLLAENGGITGMNLCTPFMTDGEITTYDDVIRHMVHIKVVAGVDVLAIGTDFDGIGSTLEMRDIGEMTPLFERMNTMGFTADEIDKVRIKNAERVIKEAMK